MEAIVVDRPNFGEIDPSTITYHDGKNIRLNYDALPRIHTARSLAYEALGDLSDRVSGVMVQMIEVQDAAKALEVVQNG